MISRELERSKFREDLELGKQDKIMNLGLPEFEVCGSVPKELEIQICHSRDVGAADLLSRR